MDYTIVELNNEIKVTGIKTADLNLTSIDQGLRIQGAWNAYFGLNLPNSGKIFGIYSDYDQTMNYSLIIGSEFQKTEKHPADLINFTIPAGKYAQFSVKGKMPEAVQKFWSDFWANSPQFSFERSFIADFELYDERFFGVDPVVDIYISIK